MKIYQDVLQYIMDTGVDRDGRNGKTRAVFGMQMRFNMEYGFPAVTTKKLAFKAVKSELLWFLQMKGKERAFDEDLKILNQSDRTIWTDNAEAEYWKPRANIPATWAVFMVSSGAIGESPTAPPSTKLQSSCKSSKQTPTTGASSLPHGTQANSTRWRSLRAICRFSVLWQTANSASI